MCGIAGIVHIGSQAGSAIDQEDLVAMRDRMAARGPDDQGVWIENEQRVGLAHRRLTIIDRSHAGHQPMVSSDRCHVIVLNGEIYNYRALRDDLERDGAYFFSDSDTEVLMMLYRKYGEAMLDRVRGMYAFGIWDAVKKGLFMARDPYGIKPLYYTFENGRLRFASQVRALNPVSDRGDLDPVAEASFLLTGSVTEPYTQFRAIKALPAGCSMWVDCDHAPALTQYTDITRRILDAGTQHNENDAASLVTGAVRESVRAHLVADVPVGCFLSAGIDSSVIAGIASRNSGTPLQTVTLGFDSYRGTADDEVPVASRFALEIGCPHSVYSVDRDELEHDIPAIFTAMDQPTIDGVNTWFVSKAAAATGAKVMLSGIGGDELFGGYPSFSDIPRWQRRFGWLSSIPWVPRLCSMTAAFGMQLGLPPKAFALAAFSNSAAGAYLVRRGLFMPWELAQFMGRERAQYALESLDVPNFLGTGPDQSRFASPATIAAMESRFYLRNQLLRDTDWASMAHSLEVRTPLVDHVLTRRIAGVAATLAGKKRLAQASHVLLPSEITDRGKTGFTTPMASWIMQSPQLDQWRRYASLTRRQTHWSRRYAACVHARFFGLH